MLQIVQRWSHYAWLGILVAGVALLALVYGASSVVASPSAPDAQAMVAACQTFMAQLGGTMSGMMGSTGSGMGSMMGQMGGMGLR